MIRRASAFTEYEIRRIIRAAKKEGAAEVVLKTEQGAVTIKLTNENFKIVESDELPVL